MADFLGKMMDGINKGVATISEGSKTFAEKAKLNTAIKETEGERKQLCELLGQQAYKLWLSGAEIPEDLINFCDEIKIREGRIANLQQNLQALEAKPENMTDSGVIGGVVCASCGYSNKLGAGFCARCGSKIEAHTEPTAIKTPPDAVICTACGGPNKLGAVFCAKCGNKLG